MKKTYLSLYSEINDLLYNNNELITFNQGKRLIKIQIEVLECVAKEENHVAQYELALRYADSGYLNPNPFYNNRKYIKWLLRSAKNGNIEALASLSVEYMSENNILGRNIVKGLSLLKQAYPKGSSLASLNYKINIKHLKNKKSELRIQLLEELDNLPDKGNEFLKMHLDYANALGR